MQRAPRRTWVAIVGLVTLFVLIQGFVWHSASRGATGLSGDPSAIEMLKGPMASIMVLFTHMVLGAVVTVLAVVQLAGPIRQRWPRLHRISGRVMACLALLTGLGGLAYIAASGTIGGPLMSVAFAGYGVLMVIAAIQTPRFAMARDYARHRRWGLRLIVLGLGSWLYRLHYGLWYGATCTLSDTMCGIAAEPDFSGLFDQINVFAFYVPYLLVLEWYLRRTPTVRGDRAPYAPSSGI